MLRLPSAVRIFLWVEPADMRRGFDGLALWYKRLEKGTFPVPVEGQGGAEIDATALAMMLEGVEFRAIRRRRPYERKMVTVWRPRPKRSVKSRGNWGHFSNPPGGSCQV